MRVWYDMNEQSRKNKNWYKFRVAREEGQNGKWEVGKKDT